MSQPISGQGTKLEILREFLGKQDPGKISFEFEIILIKNEFKKKLEWGCPNGTKYPPWQPIPNRAILPNRARLQTDGQTDGRMDRVIPVHVYLS